MLLTWLAHVGYMVYTKYVAGTYGLCYNAMTVRKKLPQLLYI